MEREEIGYITNHDQFAVVCLNKDILYTALVMINRERSVPICLPLSNRYIPYNANRSRWKTFAVFTD